MTFTPIQYGRYKCVPKSSYAKGYNGIDAKIDTVIVDLFSNTEINIPADVNPAEYCRELNELDRDRALYLKQINEYTKAS